MADLLFEIGAEEIPAGFVPPAIQQLQDDLSRALADARLACGEVKAMGTPRRLVVWARELAARLAARHGLEFFSIGGQSRLRIAALPRAKGLFEFRHYLGGFDVADNRKDGVIGFVMRCVKLPKHLWRDALNFVSAERYARSGVRTIHNLLEHLGCQKVRLRALQSNLRQRARFQLVEFVCREGRIQRHIRE